MNPEDNQKPVMDNASQRTVMGILCYLGILLVIPLIVSKDDPFVKFHIKQGLVLLSIEIIILILGMVLWFIWLLIGIIHLAVLILCIIGIINVVHHREKELPVVGYLAKHFKF